VVTYYLTVVSHLERGTTENLNLNWSSTNYTSGSLLLIKFMSHFTFVRFVNNRI
jgi:hypothetical protein